jgi:hypothetical protein
MVETIASIEVCRSWLQVTQILPEGGSTKNSFYVVSYRNFHEKWFIYRSFSKPVFYAFCLNIGCYDWQIREAEPLVQILLLLLLLLLLLIIIIITIIIIIIIII